MAGDRRPHTGRSRLQEVIRHLQEARTRAPRGSDASWPGPVADSGSVVEGPAGAPSDTGELLWRPFNPKVLERTRPFRTTPPSRDEFESHLSKFLGSHTRRTGPLFRVQGLTVRHGAVYGCADVDLEVNDGEIVAVVGPNGSGKTSLCDAVGGFLRADAGRVYFSDRDVSGLADHQRAALGLARTFERPALFGSMTVAGNLMVAQNRRFRGGFFSCGFGTALAKHEDRLARGHALEVLEILGIEDVIDHPVAALPPGIQRLVELGRVLVSEPKMAVLDEPAAGLDPKERRDLAERIGMACDEMGIALLVTDQDLPFVSSLVDYVYVLDSGALVGKGEPGDVESDSRVRAAFLRPEPEPPPPAPPPDAPWPPEEEV